MEPVALAVDHAQPHNVIAVRATATHPAHREIDGKQHAADRPHQGRRRRRGAEAARVEQEEECADAEVTHTQRDDHDAEVDGCCSGPRYQARAVALEWPGLAGY